MRLATALAVLFAAAPTRAQNRAVEAVPIRTSVLGSPAAAIAVAPALTSVAAPSTFIPRYLAAVFSSPAARPAPAPLHAAKPAAAPLPARVAAMRTGIQQVVASLGDAAHASPSAASAAGRDIENILTGAPSVPVSAAAEAPASPEELSFVAGASHELALRADDLSGKKGVKARSMRGSDFAALLDEARASAPAAPTPAAATAAREVEMQIVRVVRALAPADKPLVESISRVSGVWQVFDQALAEAAEKGTLSAVVAEAKLFASQVEESVAPAPTPAPALAPAEAHPEDPHGYAAVNVPGSVFGWQPVETSPGHGFAPLDAAIRWALSDKKSPYAAGFEIAGAKKRADARVYFYGERHTDGGLISANMKSLVSDVRRGYPLIVLVESYTGWTLHGYDAVKYLTDRGLDPRDLYERNPGAVEVRGWDTLQTHDASKHPMLQHHMNLLDLNQRLYGEARGWRYYRDFARAAWRTWRNWLVMWRAVIVARNGDLDRAVAKAAADADATLATVHVIAGTDHLIESPLAARIPHPGRISFRRSLRDAVGGRPYWVGKPPETGR